MNMMRALNSAMSGLTATAHGTETVAANLANIKTPGYARREVVQSAQTMGGNAGGVRIDSVDRAVNAALLAEMRLATSARSAAAAHSHFTTRVEGVIGMPGEPQALTTTLTTFRAAIDHAANRPDDDLRLMRLAETADHLARGLNAASRDIQQERLQADHRIDSDVRDLNSGLQRVAYLNRRIAVVEAAGKDTSSLADERQSTIDRLAQIVPLQEVTRPGGAVALFTLSGGVLLDGTRPAEFGFTPSAQMAPDSVAGDGTVSHVTLNGQPLTGTRLAMFSGGTLAANLDIRDNRAPAIQRDLDMLALDLSVRVGVLADPDDDTQPGLFTDAQDVVRADQVAGLAARLALNAAVSQPAQAWRMRDGVATAAPGNIGESGRLHALAQALNTVRAPMDGSSFTGAADLAGRFAQVESRVASSRVADDADLAVRNSRMEIITARFLKDGVDSDAEMQRLLQYEQAYAANARVIRAVDEMLDQLLRI
ncbi:flagellar hook-associated protein FlgK [Paracoccus sp. (in: a-proteobacteria)]|uniref:flagellar hook-associated protein FlgK n=1 Tax=Paracoccus sp. TaxID=267 RepID=UPI0026E024C5|nr:flagellar hook-associated protein FlgK [Paracoccus sp. (in: a-proteobacteria)]MDO5648461.1 flagellar hook-associated protein FlgK [Paracoccus sp. (in: a-proteobacteria)]